MEQSNDAANIEMDLVARSDIEISGLVVCLHLHVDNINIYVV